VHPDERGGVLVARAKTQDVVDVLVDQHNEIKRLFRELKSAKGERKEELFEDLVRLLSVHETAEEEVVHPIARRKIDHGADVVDSRLHEEQESKHALAELYDIGVDSPEFDRKLSALADLVIRHSDQEEESEFKYLRKNVPAEQLRGMAVAVKAAEAIAPTRPHPGVGQSAIANILAGPPMAVLDRIQDRLHDWRKSHSRV
jgi:hemerythrin superfamily protein